MFVLLELAYFTERHVCVVACALCFAVGLLLFFISYSYYRRNERLFHSLSTIQRRRKTFCNSPTQHDSCYFGVCASTEATSQGRVA